MIRTRGGFAALLLAASALATPLPAPKGAEFEVGFSPDKGSLDLVLESIRSARTEILAAAYSFTSKPIAEALLAAAQRGVAVRLVADAKSNGGRYSAVTFLANHGVPVRLNGRYAIFHHKLLVVDRSSLETGSFNYSEAAARKNAENVLLVRNAPALAAIYATEWERLWNESTPLPKRY